MFFLIFPMTRIYQQTCDVSSSCWDDSNRCAHVKNWSILSHVSLLAMSSMASTTPSGPSIASVILCFTDDRLFFLIQIYCAYIFATQSSVCETNLLILDTSAEQLDNTDRQWRPNHDPRFSDLVLSTELWSLPEMLDGCKNSKPESIQPIPPNLIVVFL